MKLRRWHEVVMRIPHNVKFVYVEVGVWTGEISTQVLKRRPMVSVIQVDRWEQYGDEQVELESNSRMARYAQSVFDKAKKENISRITPYRDRVKILEMESLKAARLVENNSVDMVFIDAGHSYESAKADILAWMPKIKKKGMLSGHDYPRRLEVRKAVDEIFPDGVERGYDSTWFVRIL